MKKKKDKFKVKQIKKHNTWIIDKSKVLSDK